MEKTYLASNPAKPSYATVTLRAAAALIIFVLAAKTALGAEAPYLETFDSYPNGSTPANFVETTDPDWAVYDGKYQGVTHKSRSEHYAASSIALSNVAGRNFTMTARFSIGLLGVGFGACSNNRMYLGFGAFGTDSDLHAGSAYRDVYHVAGGCSEVGLFSENASSLRPTPGPYVMTFHGGYIDGKLFTTSTITNEHGTRASKRANLTPLTGQNFGFVQFTFSGFAGPAQLTVNYDEFSVVFESEPVKLANISTRMNAGNGEEVPIAGFVVTGNSPKRILVRGVGGNPFRPGWIPDPLLELRDNRVVLLARNDNWKDTQEDQIRATDLHPFGDTDSALIVTLQPGEYTALLRDKNGATGLGLIEVFDLDKGVDSILGNLSTRGHVGIGDNAMIAGVIPTGDAKAHVIVRALGPSLHDAGISQPLADPILELRDQNGGLVRTNDNWRESQQTEVIATSLAPSDDAEAAIVAELLPMNYTAIVRGKNNTTGVALVEIYHLN